MTIAAQLPKPVLDVKGDRLRFLMAQCISDCAIQKNSGGSDKATSLKAFLTASSTLLDAATATLVKSATITLAATVVVDATTTATVAVLPADATLKTGKWTSDNPAFATVVEGTGVVTGKGAGTAFIRWTANDASGVTVTKSISVTAA